MFIIIEWNGIGAEGIIGLATTIGGKIKTFDSEVSAHSWAENNCAFHYKIVKI